VVFGQDSKWAYNTNLLGRPQPPRPPGPGPGGPPRIGTVTAIDLTRNVIATTLEVGPTPEHVALSPDGRYLIVSGTTTLETPEDVPPGGWVEPTAGGMFLVDLATMEVVYRDETTQDFTLSPNGYSLMAWGRQTSRPPPVGLTLIDLRSLAVTTMFAGEHAGPAFASPDGTLGYVRVREYFARQSGRLVAFDLETGDALAERPLEQRGQMQWDLPRGLEFSR